MMPLIPKGAALICDGTKLLFDARCAEAKHEVILANREAVLHSLRSTQMNAAGFYTTLPAALSQELRASTWVAIDLRSTADTRYCEPLRLRKSSLVGDVVWELYRTKHPGVVLSTSPRSRVLSVYTDLLGCCAFDLDELSKQDKCELYEAAIKGKVVLGHNLGRCFAWLFGETVARPAFVLDAMVIFRQVRPAALLRPYRWAAFQDQHKPKFAAELLSRHGSANVSLEYLAGCAELTAPDASYDKPAAWCVTVLSKEHLTYLRTALGVVLGLVRFVNLDGPINVISEDMCSKYPWYHSYQVALVRLSEAHVLGMGVDRKAAESSACRWLAEIETIAEKLIAFKAFEQFGAQLRDVQVGETKEMKSALATYISSRDAVVPDADRGLGAGTQIPKHSFAPGRELYERLLTAKRSVRVFQGYADAAQVDGRMHSLFLFSAATGRTTSARPALQNIPRRPEHRSIFRARQGHLVVSVDYCAMELYIATALVRRALVDVRSRIKSGEEGWFIRMLRSGIYSYSNVPPPAEQLFGSPSGLEAAEAEVMWLGQTVVRRPLQKMASILSQGLDPHLVTAADFARRAGHMVFEGDAVSWVASLGKKGCDLQRRQLAEERQAAKAANFGLLYGMREEGLYSSGVRDYGLTWTLKDARATRRAWFELYPEFSLWHLWTRHCQSTKEAAHQWRLTERGQNKGALIAPRYDVRLYRTKTLSGRPIAVLDDLNAALNHQAQGTGADILSKAIADLPPRIADLLLAPHHDELIFEVPAATAQSVAAEIELIMISAAENVLGSALPIKVSTSIGPTWKS